MALHIKCEDLPVIVSHPSQQTGGVGNIETKVVIGRSASFFVATRPPGYHSGAHIHDREQLNYAIDGECWLYVDGEAYLMAPGDFSRVPPNAVHWAWNRSDKPCTWLEVQMPGNTGSKSWEGKAVELTAEGEVFPPWDGRGRSYFVDPDLYDVKAAEAKSD